MWTTKLTFEEFDVPTIINSTTGDPLCIRGTAWVEPGSGRLWRVEIFVGPPPDARVPRGLLNRLRVDFVPHPQMQMQMMVPKMMSEAFYISGGRGNGRARYSNYRRFSTAARILPQ